MLELVFLLIIHQDVFLCIILFNILSRRKKTKKKIQSYNGVLQKSDYLNTK